MSTAASTSASLTIPCPSCAKWNRIDAARVGAGPKCGACGTALRLDQPLHLTDATFDRVIGGTTVPVLVDFYADWCGPCRMLAPAVDELARSTVGSALVAKVDTEVAIRTAQRFNIRNLPTLVVFRGGQEVKRQMGSVPISALRALLA